MRLPRELTVLLLNLGRQRAWARSKLLSQGRKVYGIEPSAGMREQIGKRELDVVLLNGEDFLQFPQLPEQVDTLSSTDAFHHLTDEEKEQAIAAYEKLLGEWENCFCRDCLLMQRIVIRRK